jgi:type IV secretion system protein VirB4
LVRGSSPLTIQEENDLDAALMGTLALDKSARRLSRLIEFTDATRSEGIHARLARWCHSAQGHYAWVFDNAEDVLAGQLLAAKLFGVDVTQFLDHALIRTPITLYLFHLIRQLLDGRQFVCWMDEFWKLLADPAFEDFAKDGPKTWRKLNGVLCPATQSPSDVLNSAISRTIIEQTPTKIFFPNPDASASEYREGFGLSEREFKLIKEQIEPGSRQFLVKQGHHSVVCELNLKGFDAELKVISGKPDNVAAMHHLMDRLGLEPHQWLSQFMNPENET